MSVNKQIFKNILKANLLFAGKIFFPLENI